MKYKELIHFEPITSVVKLVNAGELAVAESLVKTFVFSTKMKEDIQEVIIKNLIPNSSYETKGIQIVGSYRRYLPIGMPQYGLNNLRT
jgi:hypothetical protein